MGSQGCSAQAWANDYQCCGFGRWDIDKAERGSPHHFVSGVLPCPNGVLLGERWWQNFSDTLAASGVTPWREPFKADLRDAGVGNRTVRAIGRV